MKLEWNGAQILEAVKKPWVETNMLFGRKCTEMITDVRWAWSSAPSPRDIVDKGQLRDSSQSQRHKLDALPEHLWGVSYSLAVHEGARLKSGTVLPPRPWTDAALQEFHFARVFSKLANAELARIK